MSTQILPTKRDKLFWEPENNRLIGKMFELDSRYFSDMNLKKFRNKLGKMQIKDKEGKWKTVYTDSLGDMEISLYHPIDWLAVYYKRNPLGISGTCNKKQGIIRIAKGLKKEEEKLVLLHEIIHAYEFILKKYDYDYYVLLYLYKNLQKKLGEKKLKSVIDIDTQFEFREHSILFLLKSLDLDIRLKKPAGTVYGYGRENSLK